MLSVTHFSRLQLVSHFSQFSRPRIFSCLASGASSSRLVLSYIPLPSNSPPDPLRLHLTYDAFCTNASSLFDLTYRHLRLLPYPVSSSSSDPGGLPSSPPSRVLRTPILSVLITSLEPIAPFFLAPTRCGIYRPSTNTGIYGFNANKLTHRTSPWYHPFLSFRLS